MLAAASSRSSMRRARGSAGRSLGSACACRRWTAATRLSTWARASRSCWSKPKPTRSSTSTTSHSSPTNPAEAAEQWQALGFAPAGEGRVEVGGAYLELLAGDPGDPERPLLNHIGVLVDSVEEHRADAEDLGIEIDDLVDAPNTHRALRLGARPGEARVRRAQALVLAHLRDLIVAGAGMAGLVAAARARELGASPVVLEKGNRPGGSMLLSSGVVWRHRSTEDFRARVPGRRSGTAAQDRRRARRCARLARVARGEPVATETRNPRTVGRRYDPRELTDVLVRAAGDIRPEAPFAKAHVLATGGFGARLAQERGCSCARTHGVWAKGSITGSRVGAAASEGMDEFYGRAMPGEVPENEFVSASQLYAQHALVLDDAGVDLGEAAWHESDIVQRFPGGAAWYVVDAALWDGGLRTARSPRRSRSRGPRAATSGRPRSSRSRSRPHRSSRASVHGRPRLRSRHAHDRRLSGGRTGARARLCMARPSPACTRRAQTRAASSPAATAAASLPRSSTAASPPRPHCADPGHGYRIGPCRPPAVLTCSRRLPFRS